MEEEGVALTQRQRDRLRELQEAERGHLTQVEVGRRLHLTVRHIRRLLRRLRQEGVKGLIHRLRGRASNRSIASKVRTRALVVLSQEKYRGFAPTLAAEHLARQGIEVSRETVRKWMSEAGLWRARAKGVKEIHTWRERRAALGELVLMDSSDHDWLEGRGPRLQLIAMIDDATSCLRGRFAEHDTTVENLRVLRIWLERHGRPQALYTDKDSIFFTSRKRLQEDFEGQAPPTQFGRVLEELGIEWIPAHSPQAKGRVERLFGTLQDRLVKEMRVAGVSGLEAANHFFEVFFLPLWQERFGVRPRLGRDAHRPLDGLPLDSILSLRESRVVSSDYTLSLHGQRWAIPRAEVRAGLRGARVEVEQRLDGSHWIRFRGHHLPLEAVPAIWPVPETRRPDPLVSKSGLKSGRKWTPPPDHPWRRPWKRTASRVDHGV